MTWMLSYWKPILIGCLILMCITFASQAKRQADRAEKAEKVSEEQRETITDMQRRQKSVAALDAKYTKELADAKATIDQLHDDVASGKRRLQLNATCPKQSAATGVDDAAGARLTDSAQRDYFTLRERIEVAGKQIAGLQEYIHQQCFNVKLNSYKSIARTPGMR